MGKKENQKKKPQKNPRDTKTANFHVNVHPCIQDSPTTVNRSVEPPIPAEYFIKLGVY